MYDFVEAFKEGDIVKIILDLKQCRLLIQVNDRDEKIKSGEIVIDQDIKYKMVAKVLDLDSSITLKQFSLKE